VVALHQTGPLSTEKAKSCLAVIRNPWTDGAEFGKGDHLMADLAISLAGRGAALRVPNTETAARARGHNLKTRIERWLPIKRERRSCVNYRMEVYRDARGTLRADGVLDGDPSSLIAANSANSHCLLELTTGGNVSIEVTKIRIAPSGNEALFSVRGPIPGVSAA
jgi:hypothetical protein